MSVENGVMRMAPRGVGLAIKPGETVELNARRPLHLMFEDLSGAPKAGDTIQGTLTFERAGTVPVSFSVAPIGCGQARRRVSTPPAQGHHDH